jgi:hypothetical protein
MSKLLIELPVGTFEEEAVVFTDLEIAMIETCRSLSVVCLLMTLFALFLPSTVFYRSSLSPLTSPFGPLDFLLRMSASFFLGLMSSSSLDDPEKSSSCFLFA